MGKIFLLSEKMYRYFIDMKINRENSLILLVLLSWHGFCIDLSEIKCPGGLIYG